MKIISGAGPYCILWVSLFDIIVRTHIPKLIDIPYTFWTVYCTCRSLHQTWPTFCACAISDGTGVIERVLQEPPITIQENIKAEVISQRKSIGNAPVRRTNQCLSLCCVFNLYYTLNLTTVNLTFSNKIGIS